MTRSRKESLYLPTALGAFCLLLCCAMPPERPGDGGPLSVATLASFGRIRDLDFSPDGARIVYASDEEGNWSLYVVTLETGRIERLTFSPEAALSPRWSPRGDAIAYLSDYGGDEAFDIYLVPAEGGRVTRLTRNPGNEVDIDWSPDGLKIAFASDREPRPDGRRGYGIYWILREGGEATRLTRANGDDREPRWSPGGDQIVFTSTRDVGPRQSDLYVIPGEGGDARKLTTHQGGAEACPEWAPDGKRIVFHSDVSGFYDIGVIGLEGGKVRWLDAKDTDQMHPDPSSEGAVAFTSNEDGNLVVEQLSLDARRARATGIGLDYGVAAGPRWSPDGKTLAFVRCGPDTPGEIWISRGGGEDVEIVVGSEHADKVAVDRPRFVRFEAKGKGTVTAFLYGADPEENRAGRGCVLWLHDGPRGQWLNGWCPVVQAIVARGYVVLAPNFRGSTGNGVDFEAANDRDWGGLEVADIEGAAAYLEGEGLVAKGEIVVGGVGYGGFLALLTASMQQDSWAGVISVCGWVDLEKTFRRGRSSLQRVLRVEVGDPDGADGRSWYDYLSPLEAAKAIRCPVLLIAADRDSLVSPEDVQAMADVLRDGGGTVGLKVFEGAGRGLRQRRHQGEATDLILEFLKE